MYYSFFFLVNALNVQVKVIDSCLDSARRHQDNAGDHDQEQFLSVSIAADDEQDEAKDKSENADD